MRRRPPRASVVLLVMALILGAAATLLLRGHLARLAARAASEGPGRPVVVAVSDLGRGTFLTPDLLAMEEVPAPYVPPGAPGTLDAIAGRFLGADVLAGEILTRARLAPEGGPVASLVPPGLRAVAITAGVPAGTVAPGDRVDVLATFATGRPYTETVVEVAEVLTVRPASGDAVGEAATLVLLVAPDTAARLAYARTFADLAVALAPPTELTAG
jgi:pilus assembly protein CpaB